MATDKTKEQTAVLTSTMGKAFNPPRLKPEATAAIKAMRPGARPVVAMYKSADGRAKYAYDGVSIRRMQ